MFFPLEIFCTDLEQNFGTPDDQFRILLCGDSGIVACTSDIMYHIINYQSLDKAKAVRMEEQLEVLPNTKLSALNGNMCVLHNLMNFVILAQGHDWIPPWLPSL